MNSIGLQNPSVQAYIDEDHSYLKKFDTRILANIGEQHWRLSKGGWTYKYSWCWYDRIKYIHVLMLCRHGGMALGINVILPQML